MATNVCWRMSGSRSSNWLWNGSSSQSANSVYSFVRITGYLQIQDCKCIWIYVTDIKNKYFITWLLVDSLLSSRLVVCGLFVFFVRMGFTLLIPAKPFSRYCQDLVIKSENQGRFYSSVLPPFPFLFSTGMWKNVSVLQSPCNNLPFPKTNSVLLFKRRREGWGELLISYHVASQAQLRGNIMMKCEEPEWALCSWGGMADCNTSQLILVDSNLVKTLRKKSLMKP